MIEVSLNIKELHLLIFMNMMIIISIINIIRKSSRLLFLIPIVENIRERIGKGNKVVQNVKINILKLILLIFFKFISNSPHHL